MSAGRYDIKKLDRAATFSMKMILKHDGVVMSLAGFTAKASIRENYDFDEEEEPLLEFTCEIPDPSNGEVFISLTAEDTKLLVENQYYYDVILINGDYIMRVIDGTLKMSPEVTEVGGD